MVTNFIRRIMNKPLSVAQKKKLIDYETQLRIAIQQRDSFIEYLREEHEAPTVLWKLETLDMGFEPIKQNGVLNESASEA